MYKINANSTAIIGLQLRIDIMYNIIGFRILRHYILYFLVFVILPKICIL